MGSAKTVKARLYCKDNQKPFFAKSRLKRLVIYLVEYTCISLPIGTSGKTLAGSHW